MFCFGHRGFEIPIRVTAGLSSDLSKQLAEWRRSLELREELSSEMRIWVQREGGDFAELKGVGPGAVGGLWPRPRLCSTGLTGSLLEVLCVEVCRCVAV